MNRYLLGIALIFTLLFSSCKTTEYVEVPVETIKTEYKVKKDSVYLHDSVSVYKETKGDNRINENTMKKEDYYFDNVNDKNNNYIIHDFDYDNLNDFKYEINNPFCSFTGFLKESNTLSIMNKNYFC
jgi:hypothetical protein